MEPGFCARRAYSDCNGGCVGTIPKGQNSPRAVRFGLYAEQMTATAFVAPRHLNKKVCLSYLLGVGVECVADDCIVGLVVQS